MRYCPNCNRWNSGRPQICFYCGRTWHIRLCPRGHENPPDAQFCGDCGSADLTETAGSRPFWIWIVWICVFVVLVDLIVSLSRFSFSLTEQGHTFLIAIVLLIVGLNLTFSHLPGAVKRLAFSMSRMIKRIIFSVFRWCWEKLRLMFF